MKLDIKERINNNSITKKLFSLENFLDIFSKTELDLDFQRRGPWTDKNRNKFLKSLFSGKAATNISIVDVESCLNFAIKNNDLESIEYFQKMKDNNKKYVSIDGNNRSQTINKLLTDQIPFPDIKIKDNNGNLIDLKNIFFSDLGEDLKKIILEKIKVPFNIIKNTSRSELNQAFLQVNEGKSVNAQELRNATEGEVANFIRHLGSKYEKDFLNFSMKEKGIAERNHERLLSMLLFSDYTGSFEEFNKYDKNREEIKNNRTKDVTLKKNLDNLFYQKLSDKKLGNPPTISFLNEFEKKMDFLIEVSNEIRNITGKYVKDNQFFSLYLLIETLNENNYNVSNISTKEFASFFIEMETKLKNMKEKTSNGKFVLGGFSKCNDRIKNNLECRKFHINKYLKSLEETNINETFNKLKSNNSKYFADNIDFGIDESKKSKEDIILDEEDLDTSKYMKIPPRKIKLLHFLDFESKVLVDKTFQREPSWNNKQKQNYILSMLQGKDFTDIVVANIEKCKENTEDEYFENVDSKYDFISVDGNNRTQAIKDFLNNKISLPTPITLIDDYGQEILFNIREEIYLSTLMKMSNFKNFVDSIINIEINIVELLNSDKQEINNTFININEGIPVNKTEKRIAMGTDISKLIRNISNKYSYLFDYKSSNNDINKEDLLLSESNWLKREDDAILSKLLYLESNGSALTIVSENDLDNMYSNGLDNNIIDRFETKIDILFNILKYSNKQQYKTYNFIDLYIYISNILEYGYDINSSNYEYIYNQFISDEKERNSNKYYFFNNKEMIEEEVTWSFLSKDLNNMNKLMEREKQLHDFSLKYISKIDNNDIDFELIKNRFNKLNNYIEDINLLELHDEEIRLVLDKIKALFKFESNKDRAFFIQKLLDNNFLKEIVFDFDNDEISINTNAVKHIMLNKNLNKKDIIQEIKTSNLSKNSIEFLTRNLLKNNILLEKNKKLIAEANSWLIAFIENDFDLFKKIIEEEFSNSSNKDKDDNLIYEQINLRIFKQINERSIRISHDSKNNGYKITNPFKFSKDNRKVTYDISIKGVPDVIYFPTNPSVKAVGFSTTTNSDTKWEGSQILRHPLNINKLKNLLLDKSSSDIVDTDILNKLKNDTDNTLLNEVIYSLSLENNSNYKYINSSEQIQNIISELNGIETEKDKIKKLDELYSFDKDIKYYFYGNVRQSVKLKSKNNNTDEENESTIEKAELETIDIFMFAQKYHLYNDINVENIEAENNKMILLNYISNHITKIIGSASNSSNLVLSEPSNSMDDFEIIKLLITDIVRNNIKDTEYLKYQLVEEEDSNSFKWSNESTKDMINIALDFAIKLFSKNYKNYYADDNKRNTVIELIYTLVDINPFNPNTLILLPSNFKDELYKLQNELRGSVISVFNDFFNNKSIIDKTNKYENDYLINIINTFIENEKDSYKIRILYNFLRKISDRNKDNNSNALYLEENEIKFLINFTEIKNNKNNIGTDIDLLNNSQK